MTEELSDMNRIEELEAVASNLRGHLKHEKQQTAELRAEAKKLDTTISLWRSSAIESNTALQKARQIEAELRNKIRKLREQLGTAQTERDTETPIFLKAELEHMTKDRDEWRQAAKDTLTIVYRERERVGRLEARIKELDIQLGQMRASAAIPAECPFFPRGAKE